MTAQTTTAQDKSVAAVVAGITRNGVHDATVTTQDDGTVHVQRVGAASFAIVGKRGAVKWSGKGVTRAAGPRATIAR